MDRIREARRGGAMAAAAAAMNGGGGRGVSRRRPSSSSLRGDSLDDEVAIDVPEMTRLRDRGSKRNRDRSSKIKKKRGDRAMHGSGDDYSLEESVDDEEEHAALLPVRLPLPHHPVASPPPPATSASVSGSNHLIRRNFPAAAKAVKTSPALNVIDEMIGFPVPRKARSAFVKRSQDCCVSGAGDTSHRQPSSSPARPAAPNSPSSSSASIKKKIKSNGGNKPSRPSKIAKFTSIQEIEIEVAEVLFGMTRQFQPKQEEPHKLDSKDLVAPDNDVKSRISSPSSATELAGRSPPPPAPTNPSSGHPDAAHKRKKPAPAKLENAPSLSLPSTAAPSAAFEDGEALADSPAGDDAAAAAAEDEAAPKPITESKVSKEITGGEAVAQSGETAHHEAVTPAKETSCARHDEPLEEKRGERATGGGGCASREKFSIDLMAPPPGKLSPDRYEFPDLSAADRKPVDTTDEDRHLEKFSVAACKEDEGKRDPMGKAMAATDLRQLDFVGGGGGGQHVLQQQQKQQQQTRSAGMESKAEKTTTTAAPTPSMPPLPATLVSGWPKSLPPPFGYIGQVPIPRPFQSALPLDGNSWSSKTTTTQTLKRCATHCYIAKNIYHQQHIAKLNPFWPSAATAATMPLIYPPKPCNAAPSSLEPPVPGSLQDGLPLKILSNSLQDKAAVADSISGVHGKPFVVQQAPHPGAANNMIDLASRAGSAPVVFSLNQPPLAAAKMTTANGGAGIASSSSSVASGPVLPAMSFHYAHPNDAQAQYLAILQNAAYPLPIPTPVGGSPAAYRGASATQGMPFFKGPFYPPQVFPPVLSQQPLAATTTATQQPTQGQHVQQKPTTSSGSSSSQKQRPRLLPHQARWPETEPKGREDSPTTNDGRVRSAQSAYDQRLTLPILPQRFASVSPASSAIMGGGAGSRGEKAPPAVLNPSQTFAMPFVSLGNASATTSGGALPTGLDFSAVAQNRPDTYLQSLPEEARLGYRINTGSAAALHSKPHPQTPEAPRSSRDSSCSTSAGGSVAEEEERRFMDIGKVVMNAHAHHQSLNFSRPSESTTTSSVSSLLPSGRVVDSTSYNPVIASNANRKSRSSSTSVAAAPSAIGVPDSLQPQHQKTLIYLQQQQLQQQMLQLELASRTKQQPLSSTSAAAASERLPAASSAVASKHPPVQGGFLAHEGITSYPQLWKSNSVRAAAPSPPPPSSASVPPAMKIHVPPQQQNSRPSHLHPLPPSQIHQAQISFGTSRTPSLRSLESGASVVISSTSKGSSPGVISQQPVASSGSKSATSVPAPAMPLTARTASAKNTPLSNPNRKSSSLAINGNVSSILGFPHASTVTSSSSSKQQQPQAPQLFFNNTHVMSQATHLNASAAAAAYYQRRHMEQTRPPQSLPPGLVSGSAGILSMPPSPSPAVADPVKAVAADGKGMQHPAASPYIQAMPPSVVSFKATAEHKPAAA